MCPTGRCHPRPCRLASGCQGHCHPEGGSMGAAAEIQCFMSTWGKIGEKSPSGMKRTSTVSIQIFLYRARVLCRTYSLSWIRMYCSCVKTHLLCPGCVWVHMESVPWLSSQWFIAYVQHPRSREHLGVQENAGTHAVYLRWETEPVLFASNLCRRWSCLS